MSYIVPDGNSVVLNFRGEYLAPDGNNVVLNFGGCSFRGYSYPDWGNCDFSFEGTLEYEYTVNTNFTFNWFSGTYFEIEWRLFESTTLLGSDCFIEKSIYKFTGLSSATAYEWRVRTYIAGKITEWSEWQFFETEVPKAYVEISTSIGSPLALIDTPILPRIVGQVPTTLGESSIVAYKVPILEALISLDSLLGIPSAEVKKVPILETRVELTSPLEAPVSRIRYMDIPPIPAEISLPGILGPPRGLIFKRLPPSELIKDLVVWPFGTEPPLREFLEWSTDIRVSRNGTEHASRLSNAPRKSLQIESTIFPENIEWASNLIRNAPDKKWGVLDWSEPSTVRIPSGSFILPVRGNPPETGVVALWKSPTEWIIRSFIRTSNFLELDEPVYGDWFNVLILNVLVGRILQQPTITKRGPTHFVKFLFDSDYNSNIVEEKADYSRVPHYKNIDVYIRCPVYLRSDGVEDKIVHKEDLLDSESGLVAKHLPWKCPRQKRNLLMIRDSAPEMQKFREWLHRRAGRYRPFYMPSWTKDFNLAHEGDIVFYMDVDYVEFNPCYRDLAIRLKNNCWIIREIESVEEIGEILRIRFIVPINVNSENVERICYLRQYASASDRIEIHHFGGHSSQTTIPLQETVRAKPPPIYTTTPYLVRDAQEFFMDSSNISGGELRALVIKYEDWSLEEFDIGIEFVESELKKIRVDYEYEEEFDIGISVIQTILTEVRVEYEYSENMDIKIQLLSGVLSDPRVDYTLWPVEPMDIAVEVIDITLEEPE